MKKPYLAIIIPAYNSEQTLKALLDSIYDSSFKNFEVIVVDDASSDQTRSLAKSYKKLHANFSYLRLEKRSGVSVARNRGAKLARGRILTFADADIVLYPETLSRLAANFAKRGVEVVIGTLDKIPANPSPTAFQQFKALNYYSYWTVERDPKLPVGGFGGALGSIKRELWQRVGGFDENYREMEDQEMGWRITRLAEIHFDPRIAVRHFFPGFVPTFYKFYLRSYQWPKIFEKYRRFFGPAMNPREILVAGLANLSLGFFGLALFWPAVWWAFVPVFAARLILGRKFLLFVLVQKGPGFLPATLFFSHALYVAVYLGAARYAIEKIFRR